MLIRLMYLKKSIVHKKAIVSRDSISGTWSILRDNIVLTLSQKSRGVFSENAVNPCAVYLTIKKAKNLYFPKDAWNNKKSLILKRHYEETD